jgi:hypothetical protein
VAGHYTTEALNEKTLPEILSGWKNKYRPTEREDNKGKLLIDTGHFMFYRFSVFKKPNGCVEEG